MISNYVEQRPGSEPIDLGPCRCPMEPKPHEQDSAVIVDLFGYGDRGDIRYVLQTQGLGAFHREEIVRGVISWTLVNPDGTPRPINAAEVRRLDEATVQALSDGLDDAWRDDPLPNPSSEPSASGSQTTSGRTRTTRKPATSTTT